MCGVTSRGKDVSVIVFFRCMFVYTVSCFHYFVIFREKFESCVMIDQNTKSNLPVELLFSRTVRVTTFCVSGRDLT